jgi:hypothetical protein
MNTALLSIAFTALMALSAGGSAEKAPVAPASGPEAIVQAQLDAYNAHEIDAFVATYAEDIQLFEHPSKLLASGHAQLRERYAPRFKDSLLHCTLVKRIVLGSTVIDEEFVVRTFPEGAGSLRAVAIYDVQAGKIAKTWLILGPKVLDSKQ